MALEVEAAGLGDLIMDNLAVRLDANAIESRLGEYGLRRAQLVGSRTIIQAIETASGNWKRSVEWELLRPTIPRSEATDIVDRLKGEDRLLFAVGAAGGGKSAVLHQAVSQLESDGWVTLALRLDRIEPFTSTTELGQSHVRARPRPSPRPPVQPARRPTGQQADPARPG